MQNRADKAFPQSVFHCLVTQKERLFEKMQKLAACVSKDAQLTLAGNIKYMKRESTSEWGGISKTNR